LISVSLTFVISRVLSLYMPLFLFVFIYVLSVSFCLYFSVSLVRYVYVFLFLPHSVRISLFVYVGSLVVSLVSSLFIYALPSFFRSFLR